jgi:hypothetical protein
MHFHASVTDFLVFLAYLIVAGFILRAAAVKFADRPLGRALAFIF